MFMVRIFATLFLSFGMLSACAPKCPKLPPCNHPKKKEVKKVSKAFYINWVKRKTFGVWISAWGANPRCTPPYLNPKYPADLTVSCKFPGRDSFQYSFQIPYLLEVEGQCPVSRMVPVTVMAETVMFGKWVRAMARRSRLVMNYHEAVPYLCTTDLTKRYCTRFPISKKRETCLRAAYKARKVKRRHLVAEK